MIFFPGHKDAASLALRPALLFFLLYCLCSPLALARNADCTPRVQALRPVPAAATGELTLATQNMQQLFDDIADGNEKVAPAVEYRQRLTRLSRQVLEVLGAPGVLAVQEVESEKVLADLAAALQAREGGVAYRAVLREGNDHSGIDVGFLVRADWTVLGVEQLLARERLDRARLFDRPPLLLRLRTPAGEELEVINVHLKSLYGSDRSRAESERIARKRRLQANALADWLQRALAAQPQRRLVLLGDFNATPGALGGVDVLARLEATGLKGQVERLPPGERYTYVFRCRGNALDHVLLSAALQPRVERLAVSRGNAGLAGRLRPTGDSPLRSADHDGLVLYLAPPGRP
jgi:predicted extracellular nuclease